MPKTETPEDIKDSVLNAWELIHESYKLTDDLMTPNKDGEIVWEPLKEWNCIDGVNKKTFQARAILENLLDALSPGWEKQLEPHGGKPLSREDEYKLEPLPWEPELY